jgi:crossover junction endonuclease MUS81
MMEIIIDNRENSLIKLLEENKIVFIKKNLEIGDIQFIENDKIIYILERKTINDLGASIKDGRYKEQKMRLLSNHNNNIYYIIEGNIDKCNTLNRKALLGSIINMSFRDNIKIISSNNIKDTYDIIIQIQKKYNDGKFKKIETTQDNYISSIKTNKKENMNKELCNIIQLATIPGVSQNISKIIMEKYGSMSNLIEEYKKTDNLLLADISLGKRKIGKVLSIKIYDYLI